MAALLHDVGLVVVAAIAPESLKAIDGPPEGRFERERAAFGATHADIGAHLLDLWGLPLPIVEAVHLHHTPEDIPPTDAWVAAVAHVADAVVRNEEPNARLVAAYNIDRASVTLP